MNIFFIRVPRLTQVLKGVMHTGHVDTFAVYYSKLVNVLVPNQWIPFLELANLLWLIPSVQLL